MEHLSLARYDTYWRIAGEDHPTAMALYEWNLRAAAATLPMLGLVEVALRNTLDQSLRVWSGQARVTGNGNWTEQPPRLVWDLMRKGKDLEEARSRAERAVGRRRHVTHDDIVAHLNFGDLRYMLPVSKPRAGVSVPDVRTQLWEAAFSNVAPRPAFPHFKYQAHFLGQSVAELHLLRNRVVHLEPLLRVNLLGKRRAAGQVLSAIDPDLKSWLERLCSLPVLAAEKEKLIHR